jgi:TldD protein
VEDFVEAVIDAATRGGADYADARAIEQREQYVSVRNRAVDSVSDGESVGFGVRVLVDGAWGFSSSTALTTDAAERCAREAVELARAAARVHRRGVELDPLGPVSDSWSSPVVEDPFAVPVHEKVALLVEAQEAMGEDPAIKVREGMIRCVREHKVFLSTEGRSISQSRTETGTFIEATAIGDDGEMQNRSYPASHGGNMQLAGFEFIRGLDLPRQAPRLAAEAVALLTAPDCPSGRRTIILDTHQMALQVHESVGHPTELDRIFGWEASYAGTSFLGPDDLGRVRYGSPAMHIVADATAAGGLGTFAYDDEGVPAQRVPIVSAGMLAGFLTSRETAARIGQSSGGMARADGPTRIPLIRMTNVNLEPGDGGTLDDLIGDTRDGILMATNKSWSIDDKRRNFQFGTEIGWEIRNGRVGRILRNPSYTGITTEFWGSLDAVCGPSEWRLWGVPNCGKGEPGQTAHVAHGAAPSRFQDIEVGVTG